MLAIKPTSLYIGVAILAFTVGIATTRVRKANSTQRVVTLERVTTQSVTANEVVMELPLTEELVSRSLQTHSFRTDRLRRNSDDEIVWRWLKESISKFPQNWVKLSIEDNERYVVTLHPIRNLETTELFHYNEGLKKKGLPLLDKERRYLPIEVYMGGIVCPSWSGIIDVKEARLMFFEGISG
jgi:hypothetical protein